MKRSEANEDEKLKGLWKEGMKKMKRKGSGKKEQGGRKVGREVERKGWRWKDKR